MSKQQFINTSKCQHFNLFTPQYIYVHCTPQFINTSINQYFNLSTPQYIYTPTLQLLNNQHLRLLTHPFYQCLEIIGSTMAQWYVICLRIWIFLLHTMIKTKKLMNHIIFEIFKVHNIHNIQYICLCICLCSARWCQMLCL